jgi:hypothetical protein
MYFTVVLSPLITSQSCPCSFSALLSFLLVSLHWTENWLTNLLSNSLMDCIDCLLGSALHWFRTLTWAPIGMITIWEVLDGVLGWCWHLVSQWVAEGTKKGYLYFDQTRGTCRPDDAFPPLHTHFHDIGPSAAMSSSNSTCQNVCVKDFTIFG